MKTPLLILGSLWCLAAVACADSVDSTVFWKLDFKDPSLSPAGSLVFEKLSPGGGPEGNIDIQAAAVAKEGKAYGLDDLGSDKQHDFLKMDGSRKSHLIVKCPEETGIEHDDFSIAFWIKAGPESQGHIAINRTVSPYWSIGLHQTGQLIVAFNGYEPAEAAGKTQVTLSRGSLDTDSWNHVAVVFDRNQSIVIYLNGQLETISKPIADHKGAMAPSLAIAGGYDPFPTGQLANVTFYRGKLSEAEIAKLSNPSEK